jgi:drug/metabolite transporter (DMT)-like permease
MAGVRGPDAPFHPGLEVYRVSGVIWSGQGRGTAGEAAWMTLVALLWAICFPFIVIGLPDAPPLLFAGMRALLAGSLLALVAVLRGLRFDALDSAAVVSIGFIGVTYTAMGFGGMFLGAGLISPGLATVLAGVQPLFAAVLAIAWLGERMRPIAASGLLVGFVGVIILSWPGLYLGHTAYLQGVSWILLAALGTAVGNVLMKRLTGGPILLPMAAQLMVGAALLLAASAAIGEPWSINWTLQFAGSLLVLSALATALMVVLWYWLLARSTLNRLNVFSFLTPAFGLAMGYLFFEERLDLVQLAGIAVVLAGISLMRGRSAGVRGARLGQDDRARE